MTWMVKCDRCGSTAEADILVWSHGRREIIEPMKWRPQGDDHLCDLCVKDEERNQLSRARARGGDDAA